MHRTRPNDEAAKERRKTVILNISGTKFETFQSTLKRYPGTLLERLGTDSPYYRPDTGEYFFERNPHFFSQILNFYRYGTLHLQRSICGPTIKRELDFWGVSMGNLERCCLHYFKACVSNDTALEVCDIFMEASIDNRLAELFSINLTFAEKVRKFLDDPSYSRAAKVGEHRLGSSLRTINTATAVLSCHLDVLFLCGHLTIS